MPKIRPHSDKSSDTTQPASSYCESLKIRFVDGCTIIRSTPDLCLPAIRRRAQCDGVRGALLSHLFEVSARMPTTPLPIIVFDAYFPVFFCDHIRIRTKFPFWPKAHPKIDDLLKLPLFNFKNLVYLLMSS